MSRSLELIDEGETDHKIIALRISDPNAANINNMQVEIYLQQLLYIATSEYSD